MKDQEKLQYSPFYQVIKTKETIRQPYRRKMQYNEDSLI